MPRRTQNMNSLSRGRVRTSMNKYNLFNLYKKPTIKYQGKTLYQQKWVAKAETRAYHGEHLTEKRWKQLFDPNLHSVAQLDASLKGLGVSPTPMSLQTYATLEKRLEYAVFRSMFASSVRQARQFILTGHVKVNGVTIKHPSFPLKSGDVFNVAPEKVLTAMSRVKPSVEQAIKVDSKQINVWNRYVTSARQNPKEVWDMKSAKPESLDTINKLDKKSVVDSFNISLEDKMKELQKQTTRQNILKSILSVGKGEEVTEGSIFNELYGEKNAVKCLDIYSKLFDAKHEILTKDSFEAIDELIKRKSTDFSTPQEHKLISSVKQVLNEIVKSHQEYLRIQAESGKLPESNVSSSYDPKFGQKLQYHNKLNADEIREDESKAVVDLPWQKGLFGRAEPSKPYFTPWTPKPFIGCFAILPSHIEISFATCHAIYLRDPVARPGHSEVITPFPTHVHERAYMYYARKGM